MVLGRLSLSASLPNLSGLNGLEACGVRVRVPRCLER